MITLLIPTTFTDVSRHATDYAIELFRSEKLKIILLNCFEQTGFGRTVNPSLIGVLRKNSEKGLFEDKLRIEENFAGLDAEIIIKPTKGDLISSIRDTINEYRINLIVMGSEGSREIVDLFIESQTARVIKNIDHAMLIVPPNAAIGVPENVVFATDCKPLSGIEVIEEFRAICRRFSCKVSVLHIAGDDTFRSPETEKHLSGLLNGINHDFSYRNSQDIPTGIYKFMQEKNAQVVTLIKRKNRGSLVDVLFHVRMSMKIVKHVRQTMLLFTDSDHYEGQS